MSKQTSVRIDKSIIERVKKQSSIYQSFSNTKIVEAALLALLPEKDRYIELRKASDETIDLTREIIAMLSLFDYSSLISKIDNLESNIPDLVNSNNITNNQSSSKVTNDMLMHELLQIKYVNIALLSSIYRPQMSSDRFKENKQLMALIPNGIEDGDKKPLFMESLFNKISTNMFDRELSILSQNKALKPKEDK